jgi:hypothetical protein
MFGSDVFVRDRETDKTERVSLTSDGTEFVDAFAGTLSADGRYVAFHATRTGQSSSDFGAWADVYVHDRVTDSTELSSATSRFSDYLVGDSENAVITGDGRYVYFQTLAPNFVPGDGNEYMDIVRRVRGSNRGLLSIKVDRTTDGSRLSGVATFGGEVLSSATDATDPGLDSIGADITSASTTYRHEDGDILFRIGLDSIPSLTAGNAAATGTGSAGGVPALVYGFSFTLNGERWEIRGATASASEASTPAFARYYCEPVCLPGSIAIPGGFGTAGPEIQISLPAPLMGLQPGEKLEAIRGFVGPGEMATGALASLDEITLGDVTIPDAQVFLGRGSQDSAAFEIGASSFSGAFAELLQGAIPENGAFWAKACLDDRCGEPEKIN